MHSIDFLKSYLSIRYLTNFHLTFLKFLKYKMFSNNTTTVSAPHQKCIMNLFLTDGYNMTLNILRITLFTLFFGWAFITIMFKEFHKKNMAFLFNLGASSLAYSIWGLTFLFSDNCHIISPLKCYFQVYTNFIVIYSTNYSHCSFALHRLACVCFVNLDKRIKWSFIIVVISFIWIAPIVFTTIFLTLFDIKIYYDKVFSQCMINASKSLSFMIIFFTTSFIIPSSIIYIAYIVVMVKVSKAKKASKSSNPNQIQPLRITLQLSVYIILYELSNGSSILISILHIYLQNFISEDLVRGARIAKWFQFYCPLGLVYFHPVMLRKYQNFFRWVYGVLICQTTINNNNSASKSESIQLKDGYQQCSTEVT